MSNGDSAPADVDGDGTSAGEDCDDADATSYPGADEVCDEADNDCDGEVDEGVSSTFYADADDDGYGDATLVTEACTLPVGHATDSTDCDDADATVSPGAAEVWYDGADQDCDGANDYDQDGDTEESSAHGGTDCDDRDPLSYRDEGTCRCLEAWWPFDDGAGTVARDLSGNGYGGSLEGGATWTRGAVGGAVQLNGDGGFVTMGDILNGVALPMTVSAWVWPDGSEYFRIVQTDDHASVYSGIYFSVGPDDRVYAGFGDGTGGGGYQWRQGVASDDAISRGAWTHLTAVIRGAGDMDLYVDGALVPASYDGAGGDMSMSSYPFNVGMTLADSAVTEGAIDELRLHGCEVGAAEIAVLATP